MSETSSRPIPKWIAMWFLLTFPIMIWDAGFILSRPASLPGGSMEWLWFAYKHYIAVDTRFANPMDTMVVAFTWVNLFDALLGLMVFVQYFRNNKSALLWAFAAALVTWTKTVLYFAIELVGGRPSTGQASTLSFALYFLLLNGIWILVPTLILWSTSKRISAALQGG